MMHVVVIPPDGAATSVYSEKFSLDFLGKQRIQRAGEIVWNESDQSWSVYFVNGDQRKKIPGGDGFATYEEARRFEEHTMTTAMLYGVHPLDVRENVDTERP